MYLSGSNRNRVPVSICKCSLETRIFRFYFPTWNTTWLPFLIHLFLEILCFSNMRGQETTGSLKCIVSSTISVLFICICPDFLFEIKNTWLEFGILSMACLFLPKVDSFEFYRIISPPCTIPKPAAVTWCIGQKIHCFLVIADSSELIEIQICWHVFISLGEGLNITSFGSYNVTSSFSSPSWFLFPS